MLERNFESGGKKKLVLAGGLGSKSGDVKINLRGFLNYCQRELGFDRQDFLELSYNGRFSGESWEPASYNPDHTKASLLVSTNIFIRNIAYYNRQLPREIQMHFIGESLGGYLMFQALSAVSVQSAYLFGERYATLSTLASPHFGSDLGAFDNPLELGLYFLIGSEIPQGTAVDELRNLGGNPLHRLTVVSQADLLREYGLGLLTLVGRDDVVVTPDESIIAPDHARDRYILDTSPSRLMGTRERGFLRHGDLSDTYAAWQMLGGLIGPQVSL